MPWTRQIDAFFTEESPEMDSNIKENKIKADSEGVTDGE